jgi:hypothetical protein
LVSGVADGAGDAAYWWPKKIILRDQGGFQRPGAGKRYALANARDQGPAE